MLQNGFYYPAYASAAKPLLLLNSLHGQVDTFGKATTALLNWVGERTQSEIASC